MMDADTKYSTINRLIAEGRLLSLLDDRVAMGRDGFSVSAGINGCDAYVFVLVEDGEAEVAVNFSTLRLERGSMLMLKPYMLVSAFKAGASFRAASLFIDKEFFTAIPESIRFHALQNQALNTIGVPGVRLNEEEFSQVAAVFRSVCCFIPHRQTVRQMMLAAMSFLLLIAAEAISRELGVSLGRSGHRDALFQGFLQLLCLHYAEHHDVGFYARQLCVSVRYLQQVVRDVTGRTVYSYISERLRNHACRLLAYSDLTVGQISFSLRFSSPSAFGKFFRTNVGVPPKKFREQVQGQRMPACPGNRNKSGNGMI